MSSTPGGFLGEHPSSQRLSGYIKALPGGADVSPEVKSYRDAVYFNYYALGLSLLFTPQNGYQPTTGLKQEDLKDSDLILDSIDLYNIPKPIAALAGGAKLPRMAELAFSTHPVSPFTVTLTSQPETPNQTARPPSFDILTTTSGKDIVAVLGEPDRKGGGAGPSSGSIGIWCEWSKDGIMVEFGGEEARGPQAWERGKDAIWRVITLFPPNPKVVKIDSDVDLQSKSLSDANRDDILKYQGVSWVKRNAIWYGTVTLYVKHYKDDSGVEHIDIRQTITGGFEGTTENRTLDWTERENEDHVFSHVKAKSRRAFLGDFDNEWLKSGWLPDTEEHGVINSWVQSDTPKSGMTWNAEQTWGFETIEVEPGKSERRYVRHIQFLDNGKDVKCKLVYDYRTLNIPLWV
ncbi:hypothetical protein HWV62_6489 [Athelia sp. TMB]|nr:hypothetical protein HWV62_6489 [Athelia sp. TMB]